MTNGFFQDLVIPPALKEAEIHPFLKRPFLDILRVLESFHSIFNLSFFRDGCLEDGDTDAKGPNGMDYLEPFQSSFRLLGHTH